MQIYYLKCKKYTESVLRFSNGMPMLSCRCALYNNQEKIDLLKRKKWIIITPLKFDWWKYYRNMIKALDTWGKNTLKNINDDKIAFSYSFRDTSITIPKLQRFFLIGEEIIWICIMMDKSCFSPDVFMQLFWLLLNMFIVNMISLKKL